MIHAKVDQVMAEVMQQLLVPVPRFIRTDHLMLAHKCVPQSASHACDNVQERPVVRRSGGEEGSRAGWATRPCRGRASR